MNLRDYQQQAVDSVLRDFQTVQSSLVVMPTGTGKTVIIAEVIKRMAAESCIVLAHREELLNQAKRTIEAHTGLDCEFELGAQKASEIFPASVLLASVQTMISGRKDARRMNKFSPFNYGLVVVDEVHHGTAASYRAVLDYFKTNPDIKVLGVTATPERADEAALGQIMDSVAFDYQILPAIKDGWLVPVQQQLVDIQSLDFSHVRTTAGDLNASDLGAVMEDERNLYGVCDATIKEIGNQKAIMFCVTVHQAQMCADILNRYRSGMAVCASGKTPKEERRRIIQDYRDGKYQVFCNCDLVGEGFDMPDASLLIDAVPTKSTTRYQQRLGRIMRPLPGVVDGWADTSDVFDWTPAQQRRDRIANSEKPQCTVMDFVGNAGRHKLIHAIDILGGKISKEIRELAEREMTASGAPTDIDKIVAEMEQKEAERKRKIEAARKARLTAKATYTIRTIDPFNAFDLVAPPDSGYSRGKSLSTKQRELLRKQGIDPDSMSYIQSKTLINELFRRWQGNLCSLRQANLLKKHGYEPAAMSRQRASELISELASNGWKRSDV